MGTSRQSANGTLIVAGDNNVISGNNQYGVSMNTDGITENDIGDAGTHAIADALAPLGVVVDELPLSPNKIWHLIQESKTKKNN